MYIVPRNIVVAGIRSSIHKTLTYSRQTARIESGKLTHDSIPNQELICYYYSLKKKKKIFFFTEFFFTEFYWVYQPNFRTGPCSGLVTNTK